MAEIKKYSEFIKRISEYIETIEDESAKSLALKYLSQIPTDKASQMYVDEFSSSERVYSCNYDNRNDDNKQAFILSASKSLAETRVSLTFNSSINHRADAEHTLHSHDDAEPEGIKRLNLKAMSDWKSKRKELLSALSTPGKDQTTSEFKISIRELKIGESPEVSIEISENTTEKSTLKNGQRKTESMPLSYKFKNGVLMSNENQTGFEGSSN